MKSYKNRNNRQIAEWFAEGKTSGRTKHLYIEGDTIYSYGSHFPIAQRIVLGGETAYLFTTGGYSTTTARHKSLVRHAIRHNVVIEARQLNRPLDLDWFRFEIAGKEIRIRTAQAKLAKARTNKWQDKWQEDIEHHEAQIKLLHELAIELNLIVEAL